MKREKRHIHTPSYTAPTHADSIRRKGWRSVSLSLAGLILMLLAVITGGCRKTTHQLPPPATGQQITIQFNLPSEATGKALSIDDEYFVGAVDVLAFQQGDSGKELLEHVSVTDFTRAGKIVTARFKLPIGTGYDLVFLINSADWIENWTVSESGRIPKGTTYSAVETGLKAAISDPWVTDTDSQDFMGMPMYGKKEAVNVDDDPVELGRVTVERILSKIDVHNIAKEYYGHDFDILEIRLYNFNKQSYVFPGQNLSTLTPSSAPITYTLPGDIVQFTNEMYVFETANNTSIDHDKRPCMVIGGNYEGERCYYRVDFKTIQGQLISIARNLQLNVNITDVLGPGWPDPETALHALPADIRAETVVWEMAYDEEIGLGGDQYYMHVSTTKKSLGFQDSHMNLYDTKLTISSDYPEAWTLTISDSPEEGGLTPYWLRHKSGSWGGVGVTNTIELEADVNPWDLPRVSYLHIKAGNLTQVVTVTQAPGYGIEFFAPVVQTASNGGNINISPWFYNPSAYPLSTVRLGLVHPDGSDMGTFVANSQQGVAAGTRYTVPLSSVKVNDLPSAVEVRYFDDQYYPYNSSKPIREQGIFCGVVSINGNSIVTFLRSTTRPTAPGTGYETLYSNSPTIGEVHISFSPMSMSFEGMLHMRAIDPDTGEQLGIVKNVYIDSGGVVPINLTFEPNVYTWHRWILFQASKNGTDWQTFDAIRNTRYYTQKPPLYP